MNREMRWARALKRRLEAWGMTQVDMARIVDEEPQRINDWVKGRRIPSDAAKAKLIERLAIDPAEVVPDWLRPVIEPQIPARPPSVPAESSEAA